MVRPIVIHPDPILERQSRPLNIQAPVDRSLIQDMIDTMKAAQGIGLAASQIGVDLCLFVMQTSDMPQPRVWANAFCASPPEAPKIEMMEGCLSIPGQAAKVRRSTQTFLTGYTLDAWDDVWKLDTVQFHGTQAQCVQHEIDHTNGILYPAHLDAALFKRITKKSRAIKDEGILNYPRGATSWQPQPSSQLP